MLRCLLYSLLGYFGGSILYARLAQRLFRCEGMIAESPDQNPGAANAFARGGLACGLFTLAGDVFKGALPVALYLRAAQNMDACLIPVLAAPVLGHAFPCYFRLHGGKGIAVTFGVLLGLLPYSQPLLLLVVSFLFFSIVVIVRPHSYRTLATYAAVLVAMPLLHIHTSVPAGFGIIGLIVSYRILTAPEEKQALEVSFLWKR